jgi:DOPA 4,5-dioxygenase
VSDPIEGPSAVSSATEPLPISRIESYHAHVYFDGPAAREQAAVLRERIAERFRVQLGRWREQPAGPHPQPMYQVAFAAELFPQIVPWLMLNRLGLTIVVHPNTDRPRDDHLKHALWLGAVLPLDGSGLEVSALGRSQDAVVPNTSPHLDPA